MAIPKDWIGKQVVCSWLGGGGVRGELMEVSDRGMVLRASRADAPSATLFCPWAGVRAIQLVGADSAPSDIGEVIL
jgi:hypothetical protein